MKTILFALRVTDLERSLAFYGKVGYLNIGKVPFDDGSSLVWLRLPDEPSVSLELVHRPADGPVETGGFEHLAIEVESLSDATARLTEAGLQPGEPVLHGADGPKTSWLTDPDGYRIELVEWPPGGPPTPDNT
ncbi:VOC family protein [Kribbella shirazensis]|jgi:lactoylglutathione lyase|uniref:Lactoylglutathione lyase n=1 Tax=Kribbella shirazensis TaxID=1105143 RepID=A0A7X5VG53_9ACTN|nr:VOC family protein [Kribbella shirazensis]NIK60598.1 lactoylglutathione lyase [Kribbella shirazensis]